MNDHDDIPPAPGWLGEDSRSRSERSNESSAARPTPPVQPPPTAAEAWAEWEAAREAAAAESLRAGHGARAPGQERDPSIREAAAQVRDAFVGRDLLLPGPGLWPWGRRARARRERRAEIDAEARRRRAALRNSVASAPGPLMPREWTPVPRRTNALVIGSLAAVVAVVFAASWYFGSDTTPPPADPAVSLPALTPSTSSASASTSTVRPSPSGHSLPPLAPIPSAGVAPMQPPADRPTDPATVAVAAAPGGEPTREETSTPEGAMTAWLARWCPYSYTDEFGAREQRARSAMTAHGWTGLDPSTNDRARASWSRVVAATESAQCSPPTVVLSPEAPRGDTHAVVIGTVNQVITTGAGARWVEHVDHTRIVLRGADGWRVDSETRGG